MIREHRQPRPFHSERQGAMGDHRFSSAKVFAAAAGIVVLTLAGVLWPGYDAVQTTKRSPFVWALNRDASLYGKLNTVSGELESIAPVREPSAVLQSTNAALLFVENYGQFTVADPASPVDLSAKNASHLLTTPVDARSVSQGHDWLLFIEESGAIALAPTKEPEKAVTVPVPMEREPASLISSFVSQSGASQSTSARKTAPLFVEAATITRDDHIAAVVRENSQTFKVVTFPASHPGAITEQIVWGNLSEDTQISIVNGHWVVLDLERGHLWMEDLQEAVSVPLDGQAWLTSSGGGQVIVADGAGLQVLNQETGRFERKVQAPSESVPAIPTEVAGRTYAAWLVPGEEGGILWDSESGESVLEYGGRELVGIPIPRIHVFDDQAVLNDTASGWVWTLPSGNIVPTSQNWKADARIEVPSQNTEVEDVLDPRPPVAVPDTFGVRPGRDAVLPVLLNDYDANQDVLSISPGSLSGLDPAFGTVGLSNGNQELVVSVEPGARGSSSFSYAVSDGTAREGLLSEPATVTLTVVPEEQDGPPFFAGTGVGNYLGKWPTGTVAPGGTGSVQVLSNWVDPEGDGLYLASADTSNADAQVLTTLDGTVVLQHLNAATDDFTPISVNVEIGSATGKSAAKELLFYVDPEPPIWVEPIVVTGLVNQPINVDLADYANGGVGELRTVELSAPADSSALRAELKPFGFSATASVPGSYTIRVTVEDGAGSSVEQTARVVVSAAEEAHVKTSPVMVFVQPFEDTTVNLLDAIENPANSVLLISDVEVEFDLGAELTANVVDHHHVRLMGRTESGAPGLVGTVRFTVSDGSGNPAMVDRGQITVIQTEKDSSSPIAPERWITVQTGVQVDVPVVNWAKGPPGSQLALDPESVRLDLPVLGMGPTAGHDTGLAFGTPTHVRYLAPKSPGEFSIRYSIHRLGAPELASQAKLNVRVIEADDSGLSAPNPLEARVLAGRSVSVDPNLSTAKMEGENYRLHSVVEQPRRGSATVSADGESLEYEAHPGTYGQDRFTYRVRNEEGRTAIGVVRVGILGDEVPAEPVAYSRYFQTSVGNQHEISMNLLDSVIDPDGGDVAVDEVWPNEPEGSAEFDQAQERILSVNSVTGQVRLRSAKESGSTSFFYKVTNQRGAQATGLIVTKAVANPTRDLPVISDTKLTAETVKSLRSGVDVLADKVVWATGPAEGLTLTLWDPSSNFRADGKLISGPEPSKTTTVPFVVEGDAFDGQRARSYGFLKIPAPADIPLALRTNLPPLEVDENGHGTLDFLEAVVAQPGVALDFGAAEVRTSGARKHATCTISGNTLTYQAGGGSPWDDSCVVPVRAAVHDLYTYLNVPVRVIPREPEPVLRPASVASSPGREAVRFDLGQMVHGQDGAPDVGTFKVQGETNLFVWDLDGKTLTVQAKDDATPTRQEALSVSLAQYPSVEPAVLTLTVGPAAGTAPRGGSVTKECSAAGGQTSCVISVVGSEVSGQVNYLPKSPLALVADQVRSPKNCPGVRFAYENETSIRASWPTGATGQEGCLGSFVVQDAQGRQSLGDNTGTVTLDLLGKPRPPHATWVATTPTSVSFQLSTTGTAYPQVEEIEVQSDGHLGTCSPSGLCVVPVPIEDLGKQRTYRFRSVNEEASSEVTTVQAWTYRAPGAPQSVRWYPNPDGKSVRMILEANAADSNSISVRTASFKNTIPLESRGGSARLTFDVPAPAGLETEVTLTAISRLPAPPENVAISEWGPSGTSVVVQGVGAPALSMTVDADESRARGTVRIDNPNGVGGPLTRMEMRICASTQGAEPTCKTGTTAPLVIEYPAGWGATVQFVAEARGHGVGQETAGLQFPVGKVLESVDIQIPGPPSNSTYSMLPSAQQCALGYRCHEWTTVNEPDLGAIPASAVRTFSFDNFATGSTTVQGVIRQNFLEATSPGLKVRNEIGGQSSAAVSVALRGPGAGRIVQKTVAGETCPASPAQYEPFDQFPTGFAQVTHTATEATDQGVLHSWKLLLPAKDGKQFTVAGQPELVWDCFAPAPAPDTDPGGSSEPEDSRGTEEGERNETRNE